MNFSEQIQTETKLLSPMKTDSSVQWVEGNNLDFTFSERKQITLALLRKITPENRIAQTYEEEVMNNKMNNAEEFIATHYTQENSLSLIETMSEFIANFYAQPNSSTKCIAYKDAMSNFDTFITKINRNLEEKMKNIQTQNNNIDVATYTDLILKPYIDSSFDSVFSSLLKAGEVSSCIKRECEYKDGDKLLLGLMEDPISPTNQMCFAKVDSGSTKLMYDTPQLLDTSLSRKYAQKAANMRKAFLHRPNELLTQDTASVEKQLFTTFWKLPLGQSISDKQRDGAMNEFYRGIKPVFVLSLLISQPFHNQMDKISENLINETEIAERKHIPIDTVCSQVPAKLREFLNLISQNNQSLTDTFKMINQYDSIPITSDEKLQTIIQKAQSEAISGRTASYIDSLLSTINQANCIIPSKACPINNPTNDQAIFGLAPFQGSSSKFCEVDGGWLGDVKQQKRTQDRLTMLTLLKNKLPTKKR